jgi:hypothetical protein
MEKNEKKPTIMNAFQLISLSNVLNLSGLFDTPEVKLIRLVSLRSLKATKKFLLRFCSLCVTDTS